MESLPLVVFRFANAEFEQLNGMLRVGGNDKRLRPQTAAVLSRLLECAGQTVSQQDLLLTVWGQSVVTDNSLAQCISEIRAALGPEQSHAIETMPRRGYSIGVPVAREELRSTPPLPAAPSQEANPVSTASRPWPRWTWAAWLMLGTLLCGGVWVAAQRFVHPDATRLSIAVLPFDSRQTDPKQNWFSDTVGEDLTTNLSRIPGAKVIARVSTQGYAGKKQDLRAIGKELGVNYLIGGYVDRQTDQVSMNLFMADTESGAIRWSERFDSPVAELHTVERRVADRIANVFHVQIVEVEATRIAQAHSTNPMADDLALQAWAAWNRGSAADVARAKEFALQALALDERSVLAWKTLASWHLRARINQSIPIDEAIAGADHAARRAMAIDPNYPLVHTVYGGALTLQGQYEAAQQALEHEIATNPSHPVAYYYLGLAHLMRGHTREAIDLYQKAITISPRDPRMSRFQRYLSLAYLHQGDLRAAKQYAQAATQAPMVDRSAWAMLASVCALTGDATCAAEAVTKLRAVWPTFSVANGETEWPPQRPEFTASHGEYLRGLQLARLSP